MLFGQTPFYQRFGALFIFSEIVTFEIQVEYSIITTISGEKGILRHIFASVTSKR